MVSAAASPSWAIMPLEKRNVNDEQQPTTPSRRRAIQWRWYHFYFLLAVFDLLVIIASLIIYDRTLDSYQLAFQNLSRTHVRQRWLAGLRLSVVALNAPGNDVFASRRLAHERNRFEKAIGRLDKLLEREREYDVDLTEFRDHIRDMIVEETLIFERIARMAQSSATHKDELELITQAVSSMAVMDRHQAAALTSLTELEQYFLMTVDSLLLQHGHRLRAQFNIEKYLLAIVVLILVGVFWYGRKLQEMHERMVADQQVAAVARHERLAAVGELCAAVAHGIRNPLSAISTSAQLAVTTGDADDATKRRMNDILTECRRLDQRVTSLLHFSSGSATVFEQFDVRDAVGQALEEIGPSIQEREIELIRDDDKEQLLVHGDRERMVQAILEVLTNAMDHVPNGGTVLVQCRDSQELADHVDIDITDDGPGIADAIQDRVFDLFFTTRSEGTGIGLASVKHTVEAHGGDVCIVRGDHDGARVRIRVPKG